MTPGGKSPFLGLKPQATPAKPAEAGSGTRDSAGSQGASAPFAPVAGGFGPRAPRTRGITWSPLGLILLLAFALRIWAVDRVPPGLDSDEVSIGYNAYSILMTGRDEYGERLPLAFRAFGEFKRPAFVYATVPAVALFGPTPLGIRLPAVVIGTASVAALYGVARLLLRRTHLALAAALFLALSPWHLQFSRGAREVSLLLLALLLLVLGLLLAVRAVRRAPRRAGLGLLLAAGGFLLALYSYPGGLVIAPLLALLFGRVFWGRLRRLPAGWVAAAGAVLALGLLPLSIQLLDGRASARAAQASLLADPVLHDLAWRRISRDHAAGVPWALDLPELIAARRVAGAYLSHFDPTYLFTRGDVNWRHRVSDFGELYLWDLPLLAAGALTVVKGRRRPPLLAIGGWLLAGPVPAAFAIEAPHAVRSIPMLPALYLTAAAGLPGLWRLLRRRALRAAWLALLAGSLCFYLYNYYARYPYEHADAWSSGALEAYRDAQALAGAGRYDQVVIPDYLDFAYAYALFATGYPPEAYLAQGGTAQRLVRPITHPPVLVFRPFVSRYLDWGTEPRDPRTLYVLWPGRSTPPDLRTVEIITDVAGHEAFRLAAFSG